MKNLGQLMKQAQAMQSQMAELQEKLAEAEIEGTAGAGMVVATLSGKGDLKAVKIDPSLVSADDVEVLEDLIVAAYADAKSKVDARLKEEMGELTGGLPLPPGLKLF